MKSYASYASKNTWPSGYHNNNNISKLIIFRGYHTSAPPWEYLGKAIIIENGGGGGGVPTRYIKSKFDCLNGKCNYSSG